MYHHRGPKRNGISMRCLLLHGYVNSKELLSLESNDFQQILSFILWVTAIERSFIPSWFPRCTISIHPSIFEPFSKSFSMSGH